MVREVLSAVCQLLEAGQPGVLCSLVETRGSTPQKAGAVMLVLPDGSQHGTLGGGCVEAEVKQRAIQAVNSVSPQLLTFYLDDNYGWDDGLICGGRMTILAQPLPTAKGDETGSREHLRTPIANYFETLRRLVETGGGCTEAVAVEAVDGLMPGSRVLIGADGQLAAALHCHAPPAQLFEDLPSVHRNARPMTKRGLAYLPVRPRLTVLVVGGGHVGEAVARLATEADFDVWVLDDREMYASASRFPQAKRRFVGDIGTELKKLVPKLRSDIYAVIVTRGHTHDEEALYHLAASNCGYVGMIGSRRKIRLIFDDLSAKGVPAEALQRVHAPIGLDIGSQTVAEIAVSIVAELIAHRNLGSVPQSMRPAAVAKQ